MSTTVQALFGLEIVAALTTDRAVGWSYSQTGLASPLRIRCATHQYQKLYDFLADQGSFNLTLTHVWAYFHTT